MSTKELSIEDSAVQRSAETELFSRELRLYGDSQETPLLFDRTQLCRHFIGYWRYVNRDPAFVQAPLSTLWTQECNELSRLSLRHSATGTRKSSYKHMPKFSMNWLRDSPLLFDWYITEKIMHNYMEGRKDRRQSSSCFSLI